MAASRVGRAAILLAALVVFGALAVACGGGGDSGRQTANGEDSSNRVGSTGDDSSPGNFGTLTVDGQVFEFKVFVCGFTPETTGQSDLSFSLFASGLNSEGRSFNVVASIVETSGSATHTVSLRYNDDQTAVVYENDTSGQLSQSANPRIAINGRQISYEGDFAGTTGPVGTGTMKASCP